MSYSIWYLKEMKNDWKWKNTKSQVKFAMVDYTLLNSPRQANGYIRKELGIKKDIKRHDRNRIGTKTDKNRLQRDYWLCCFVLVFPFIQFMKRLQLLLQLNLHSLYIVWTSKKMNRWFCTSSYFQFPASGFTTSILSFHFFVFLMAR